MKWFMNTSDYFPLIPQIILKLSRCSLFFRLFIGFSLWLACLNEISAQHPDVPYVPTSGPVVEMMLDLAEVKQGDYLIDLGSGDGRIVIAAAKRGALGHGVEIDPDLVEEAKENAIQEGVENSVVFIEGNIFDTDFSKADVVTLYLFNSINMILRPTLLKKLKPGSRVVSHRFNMNAWKPDKQLNAGIYDIYLWIVPANVEGKWSWKVEEKQFIMGIRQQFQKVSINIVLDKIPLKVENCSLSGKKILFNIVDTLNLINYVYNGNIEGDSIYGTVQIHDENISAVGNWKATVDRNNFDAENEQLLLNK